MYILLLLVPLVGVVLGADPHKCCSERQFEARLAEVGGAVYNEHGHQVAQLLNVDNILHYDFYNQSVVYEVIEHSSSGQNLKSRIVHDFRTGSRYTIKGNNCTVAAGTKAFNEQCVPDNAKYLGSSYLGFGLWKVDYNAWQYDDTASGTSVKMVNTADNCAPLLQSVFSKPGTGAGNDMIFIVTNYQPGLKRSNVFSIPPNCVSSNDVPQVHSPALKRGEMYIDAIFSR